MRGEKRENQKVVMKISERILHEAGLAPQSPGKIGEEGTFGTREEDKLPDSVSETVLPGNVNSKENNLCMRQLL